jgi:hypothetical protein
MAMRWRSTKKITETIIGDGQSWPSLSLLEGEMEMLNLKMHEAAPDFGSFIAHPLANMFPMIEGNAFEELKRDIAAQGILEPIRLYQGMILDGRNRYAAGKACGHEFSVDDFIQWEGTLAEAEAWVISTNLHRRQLTTKQKQDLIMDMVKRNPTLSDRERADVANARASASPTLCAL